MYRQKGTGRARHGPPKVSQFRGGGRAFGPVLRDAIPTSCQRRCASWRSRTRSRPKRPTASWWYWRRPRRTRPRPATWRKSSAALGWSSALVIGGAALDESFRRAADNIPGVDVLPEQGANVYDILRRDTLVLTKDAVEALEARLK